MKLTQIAAAALLCSTAALAQTDDFVREAKNRELKDPLEGKAPPALQLTGWMNVEGAIDLASLKGKVVVLDFWGTW